MSTFQWMKPASSRFMLYFCVLALTGFHSSCGMFECDFDEPGICGFSQDQTDDDDFLHHSGRTPTEGTGPIGDHTSVFGHYMYMESSGSGLDSIARLISPVFNGTGTVNDDGSDHVAGILVTFWVHMNGEEMGNLRVLMKDAPQNNDTTTMMKEILSIQGVQGSEWVKKNVTVQRSREHFQIIFEASCGASAKSDIAIDDVTVDDDVVFARNLPTVLQGLNCTFEGTGICEFQQATNDDFNLTKRVARNNRNRLAPSKDHTLGTGQGKYLSIDTPARLWNWPVLFQPGNEARLVSPMFAGVTVGEEPACLLFWYHMHGSDVGQFRVYVRNRTSSQLGEPVWALAGGRGKVWRAAEIRIDQPDDFQVVFEFVAGSYANIAIDDISLTRYECPGEHPVALAPSVNCDFSEIEICFYRRDALSDARWRWNNRATDSSFTGPSQDHTRGDELGFYMHIDSENMRPGSRARLFTPTIPGTTSPSCFEFWYHMFGSHIGRLSIYAQFNDTSYNKLPLLPLWTRSGNQGNGWHRASFMIANMNKSFEVIFEGVLGPDYRTDIAIDDVQYFPNEACLEYTTASPEVTTLPLSLPTELECSFEADICNFTQAIDDNMDWRRARANGVQRALNGYYFNIVSRSRNPRWNVLKGPHFDQTTKSQEGFYLATFFRHYSRDVLLRNNDRSRTMSPTIAGSEQPRCLTFSMYKEGSANTFFNIYFQGYGESRSIDPAFAYFWTTGKRWYRMQVDIPPSSRPLNIVFESVFSKGDSWITFMLHAIDDVKVTHGKCGPKARSVSCDFENEDLCGYNKMNWVRNTGPTPSRGTGPLADHTLGNAKGHYMYFETSQPVVPRQSSDLVSPVVILTGKQCLRFYFHNSGRTPGRLEIWATYLTTKLVATIGATGRSGWQPANIEIDFTGEFRFRFRAFANHGYQGDIAIDDIKLLDHPCTIATEASCDFELGLQECGYDNAPVNDVDWMWYDSVFGHNTNLSAVSWAGTNSFMFLKSENSSLSDVSTSEMYSGYLTESVDYGDLCLRFMYVISGSTSQTIHVYAQDRGGKRREIGTVTREGMTDWSLQTWSLISTNALRPFEVYRVVFVVSLQAHDSVVAIDDVAVSSSACSSLGSVIKSARQSSARSSGRTRSGMTAGVTIVVLLVVVAACVLAFVFRSRIVALIPRLSQTVTEMNYKLHDVGFVNKDKAESVEIPSVPHNDQPDSSATSSVEGPYAQIQNI